MRSFSADNMLSINSQPKTVELTQQPTAVRKVVFTYEHNRGSAIHKRSEQGLTAEQKTKRLKAVFDAMTNGLSQDELAEMTAAMTGVRSIDEVRRQRKAIRALAHWTRSYLSMLTKTDMHC